MRELPSCSQKISKTRRMCLGMTREREGIVYHRLGTARQLRKACGWATLPQSSQSGHRRRMRMLKSTSFSPYCPKMPMECYHRQILSSSTIIMKISSTIAHKIQERSSSRTPHQTHHRPTHWRIGTILGLAHLSAAPRVMTTALIDGTDWMKLLYREPS